MSEGLVRGEGFAVDASIVQADANRRRGVPSEQPIDWPDLRLGSRAVNRVAAAIRTATGRLVECVATQPGCSGTRIIAVSQHSYQRPPDKITRHGKSQYHPI
jgi:hypothetical protein